MAQFDPEPPPLDLPVAPDVLSPNIPLNPPMVGEASPFIHVDGQNRDIILESIRTWVRVSLLPWTTSWQEQLTAWETDTETQLNAWMVLADAYITEHAIAGLSFRKTADNLFDGVNDVAFTGIDQEHRPLAIGDLVLSTTTASPDLIGGYGIITALIDATHASVTRLGSLRGPAGLSFRTTITPILAGDTNAVFDMYSQELRPLVLGDLALDQSVNGNYGIVSALIDATHATVTYIGSLRGPVGPEGPQGDPGVVQTIVAGTNISVDDTDPANPIVTATGSGFGIVQTIVAGDNITVDDTDPENPIVSSAGGSGIVESVVAGSRINVDATDPANPIVGTDNGIPLNVFATADRPEALVDGDAYFDSTLLIPVWSYGGVWRDSAGTVIPDPETHTVGIYTFTPGSSFAVDYPNTVAMFRWDSPYTPTVFSGLDAAAAGFEGSTNVLIDGSNGYMLFPDDETGTRIFAIFDPESPTGTYALVASTDLPFSSGAYSIFRVTAAWIDAGDLHFLISCATTGHGSEQTHHCSWNGSTLSEIAIHADISAWFWTSILKNNDELYLTKYADNVLSYAADLTSPVSAVTPGYTGIAVGQSETGEVLAINDSIGEVVVLVAGDFDSMKHAPLAGSTPVLHQIFDYDGSLRENTITWIDDSDNSITKFVESAFELEAAWVVDDTPTGAFLVPSNGQVLVDLNHHYFAVTNYDAQSGFGLAPPFQNYCSATYTSTDPADLIGAYDIGMDRYLIFDRTNVGHHLDIVRVYAAIYALV